MKKSELPNGEPRQSVPPEPQRRTRSGEPGFLSGAAIRGFPNPADVAQPVEHFTRKTVVLLPNRHGHRSWAIHWNAVERSGLAARVQVVGKVPRRRAVVRITVRQDGSHLPFFARPRNSKEFTR